MPSQKLRPVQKSAPGLFLFISLLQADDYDLYFPRSFKAVNYCLIYHVFSIGSIGEVCWNFNYIILGFDTNYVAYIVLT